MRRWIIILFLAVILMGFVALLVSLRPRQASVKLADGSILTVQKVAFGKPENLAAASWSDTLKQKLLEKLPRAWVGRFLAPPPRGSGSWASSAMSYNPNVDGLQIYFNRRDAAGKFQEVKIYTGDIIDEHGCVFVISAAGGSDNGKLPPGTGSSSEGTGSTITRLTYQEFPRQQKEFRLRLYDVTRQFMGEVTVRNPAWPPKPRAKLAAQEFPISKQEGDVTYTLLGVNVVTNWESRSKSSPRFFGPRFQGPLGLQPKFEVHVHGQVVTDWTIDDMDLFDGSGNVAPKQLPLQLFLCTNEPAWQLKVKFSGPWIESPNDNVLMTAGNISVPESGKFVVLRRNNEMDGVRVELLGLSGPGELNYSNGVPIPAWASDGSSLVNTRNVSFSSGSRQPSHSSHHVISVRAQETSGGEIHFPVVTPATQLSGIRWLTVIAYDERGRRYGAYPSGMDDPGGTHPPALVKLGPFARTMTGPTFLNLDLPPDVKTITLVVALEGSSTEEFIFKPPVGK